MAEFGAPAATVALLWVFLVRGCKGFGWEQEGGGEKVSITLVLIGTMGSPEFFDVGCSMPYFLHDVSMLLDIFGGGEHDGVLKHNQKRHY